MQSPKRTTYLNRVESEYSARQWYRRDVTLLCNLLFTGKWMRKSRVIRCLVVDISEGGATVRIGKSQVPDHVYLVFGRFDVVVGSMVVERTPGAVHLCFVKQLSPRFVNRLARMTSPFSTLESLSPMTISASENPASTLNPSPPPPDDGRKAGMGQPSDSSKRP